MGWPNGPGLAGPTMGDPAGLVRPGRSTRSVKPIDTLPHSPPLALDPRVASTAASLLRRAPAILVATVCPHRNGSPSIYTATPLDSRGAFSGGYFEFPLWLGFWPDVTGGSDAAPKLLRLVPGGGTSGLMTLLVAAGCRPSTSVSLCRHAVVIGVELTTTALWVPILFSLSLSALPCRLVWLLLVVPFWLWCCGALFVCYY
jgi:hypothetical protein